MAIIGVLIAFLAITEFITLLVTGRRILFGVSDFIFYLFLPLVFIMFETSFINDCCGTTATFSPAHRLSVYVLILICVANYFYCLIRKTIAPPVIEIVVNCILILSSILNIIMIFHLNKSDENSSLWILGNIPIILLNLMMLIKNHKLFIDYFSEAGKSIPSGTFSTVAWKILNANPFIKYPGLLILCLPLIVILSTFLLIFGQRPDSIIRSFTDTYKHGLSQLDHECEGVICEGHYLCTIAAKGHRNFVKPIRFGIRGGQTIICNRQLLVSNAFEELVQQKMPGLHCIIRKNYDRIGNIVERYYSVFNHKLVSDVVYIVMKPLEWFFVLILYCCDKNPENRIARQYTGHK